MNRIKRIIQYISKLWIDVIFWRDLNKAQSLARKIQKHKKKHNY